MTVIEYVTEEVRRQGHDVRVLDGIERVGWMLDGWRYALNAYSAPTMRDIEHMGTLIERIRNENGFRSCGVRVGSRICPPAQEVRDRLIRLLELQDSMTPIEFYKMFEEIHPFVDGNGRTGKILLNWKNGTLLNPVFPPADLFGEPILNP